MNIKDINSYSMPDDVSGAAQSIRLLFSLTGNRILSNMSDESVVDLWMFGLREVEQLSEHNVTQGNQAIIYPHIWLKKYLFSKVYTNWLAQEADAKALLDALSPIINRKSNLHVLPSVGQEATTLAAYPMPPIRNAN